MKPSQPPTAASYRYHTTHIVSLHLTRHTRSRHSASHLACSPSRVLYYCTCLLSFTGCALTTNPATSLWNLRGEAQCSFTSEDSRDFQVLIDLRSSMASSGFSPMDRRELGSTGIMVPPLGFGASTLGDVFGTIDVRPHPRLAFLFSLLSTPLTRGPRGPKF